MSVLKPTRGIRLNKTHLLARDLVVFWPFSEGSGDRVFDLVNGRIGTLDGDAVSWTSGKYGSAINLGASVDRILCPGTAKSFNASEGTIDCLIKPNWNYGDGLIHHIWFTYGGSNESFFMSKGSNGTTTLRTAGANRGSFTFEWQVGVSYHLVLVWGENKLYINNVLVNDFTDGGLGNGSDDLYIGDKSGGDLRGWDGTFEWFRVWNRGLTTSEIALLYREPFVMFEPALNIARIASVVVPGFVEIAGSLAAESVLTDVAALKRARVIAGGVTAQSSLSGSIKVSRKISGVINATSSLSGTLSLVGEVSRSRGSGFKPIEGAERLRGLRRSAFY